MGRRRTGGKSSEVGAYRGALTAAAVADPMDEQQSITSGTGYSRTWQRAAWGFYDETGELWYAANFIGSCFARIVLTLGIPDKQGHVGPVFDEDGKILEAVAKGYNVTQADADEALAAIRALRSKVGGQQMLMRALGLCLSVTGECFLFGSEPDANRNAQDWLILSTDELVSVDKGYQRIPGPGQKIQDIPGNSAFVTRIYRPHPRWSALADAAVKPLLPVLDELQLLTRGVRAEILSRLAVSGVWVVPKEIDYESSEEDSEEDEGGDPLTRDLIRTSAAGIADKSSAVGVVPFVFRAPYQYCDKEHLRFDKFFDASADLRWAAKRDEAIKRFANGIDLPVEIVTGMSGTTFANAVTIDDSTYKSHIEPAVQTAADSLTVGYLHVSIEGTPFVIDWDASDLVTRPNHGADAKDAFDRYELSGSALRRYLGFSESDAPDDEEIVRRTEIKRLQSVREAVAVPTEADILNEEQRILGLQDRGGSGGEQGQGGGAASISPSGLPVGSLAPSARAAAAYGVTAAAEVLVDRAVRRVGARLRSKAAKDQNLRALIQNVPDDQVALTIGRDKTNELLNGDLRATLDAEFTSLERYIERVGYGRIAAGSISAMGRAATEERLYDTKALLPGASMLAALGFVTSGNR